MVERSPLMGVALFFAPTMCVIALRFGLPVLDEVISNDLPLEIGIHSVALLIGLVMFLKYRVVEDHEYHRSAAIKRLTRAYSQEDKGLWARGDAAIERLEAEATIQKTGKQAMVMKSKLSGNVGSLNVESREVEVEDDLETEVVTHLGGINTIVDEHVLAADNAAKEDEVDAKRQAAMQKKIEKHRLKEEKKAERQKAREEKARIKAEKAASKKVAKQSKSSDDSMWDSPSPSTMVRTVSNCKDCGTVNHAGSPYCSSCGGFLS